MTNELVKQASIYYYTGEDNKEYWELLKDIKNECKFISSKWSGDYIVSEYESDDNHVYRIWENMELGIQSEIEIFKKK